MAPSPDGTLVFSLSSLSMCVSGGLANWVQQSGIYACSVGHKLYSPCLKAPVTQKWVIPLGLRDDYIGTSL